MGEGGDGDPPVSRSTWLSGAAAAGLGPPSSAVRLTKGLLSSPAQPSNMALSSLAELGLPGRGCCLVLGFMYKEKYRRMTEGEQLPHLPFFLPLQCSHCKGWGCATARKVRGSCSHQGENPASPWRSETS